MNDDIAIYLRNCPIVLKLYIKFNAIKSIEAICERMFTYAGKPVVVWFYTVRSLSSLSCYVIITSICDAMLFVNYG